MQTEQAAETVEPDTKIRDRFSPRLAPLVGFLIFLPTLWYGFVWDDRYGIVENPSLRSWKTLALTLWGKMDPTVAMYRPVTGAAVFFMFQFFGLNAWGYHLASISLHALVCFLTYRIALQLSGKRPVAVFASLLFAVHAAHLEAVAWISAVAEPLVASAVLSGLLCYLRYRRARQNKWLAATCLCLFIGLLTKETAIILPLLLLALEFTFANWDFGNLRRDLPLIASLAGTGLVYVTMRHFAYPGFVYNESKIPFSTLLLTWPSLLLIYCRHLVIPTPLSPFYDSSYVTTVNASLWVPLLALIAIAAIVYFGTKFIGNDSLIRFCALAMAISIIPALDLNIFQFREIMHDRFLYIPSIFFSILVGQLLFGFHGKRDLTQEVSGKNSPGTIPIALGVCLILLNVAALLIQSPVWKNDMALMSYAVRVSPGNPRPVFTLATMQLERGDLPQAELLLEHVVQLAPAPKAWFLLGQTRMRLGHPDSAEQPLRQAIAAAPGRSGYHFALGQCLQVLGRTAEARAEFEAEIGVGSDFKDVASHALMRLQPAN